MKKKSIKLILAPLSILFVVSLFAFNRADYENSKYFQIAKNLDILASIYKEVNGYYVDEVNPNELMKTGIDAMLKSLDPYTSYIPEDDIEDYRTMTTGEYGGIGAVIGRRNDKNLIMMPYDGFPANKAGLKIADEILKIDGIDVKEKTTSEISDLLKGQANTKLMVTVKRFGLEEPIDISIKRQKITLKNVPFHGIVKGDVGYIKLTDFTTGAGKEVKNALISLKKQGAKKIILDLRGNPGGLLNEAVNVSNVFVPKGSEIVSTKGKIKDWNKTYNALNRAEDTRIPLVVLANGRSASASEIVSGVIQDYDRGVLIGQKTYGKGLVQATRPLNYNSQLKITTAKYYIPSGRCIQAIDYSHKDENGKAIRLPDSLKTAYKTRNGRVVYDGAGVDPDITVTPEQYNAISYSLSRKGLIFDYATEYHFKNKSIEDPYKFSLSDEEYLEFSKWLKNKEYDYTTKTEAILEELEKLSKEEEFDGSISQELEALNKKIKHDKEKDLFSKKEEIMDLLTQEICSRYYLSKGSIISSFNNDSDIQKAIEILNKREEYLALLSNQKK